ncbi:ABC transporter substrate-binding protein [Actinoplanes sp. ATCC 53533]|uniref:ABC transporter substrate-binding protein n=1 Tax=Actinoplanes sp. ATCC 53533 TaxID=1288362 RepID=UPI0013151E8D|nr:ABC transporter substrate-binding protein [Actinoplanes sp. ATCC 53533]
MAQHRRTARLTGFGLAGAVLLATTACSGSGSGSSTPSGDAISSIGTNQVSTGTATKDVDAVTWSGDYRPLLSLDPVKVPDYPEETAIPNICEPLIRVAPDYSLSPGLAASYTFTNPTTLVLKLRQAVKFSDGAPMTSADVAFSLNRNRDPNVASGYGFAFAKVKSIAATDPSTVTITFTQPSPTFPNTLATLAGAVVRKSFAEAKGAAFGSPDTGVVCTGPFKFTSYDGSTRLVLTRNDDYWDTARKARAKTFTFVYATDNSALVNGLMSGQIQGAFNLPSNLLDQLGSAPSGKVYLGGEGSTPVNLDLLMAKDTGPGADPRVRQALSLVIDRPAIAKTIFKGASDPLYKVVGPGLWGYERDTFRAAYQSMVRQPDVPAAKALVEQANAGGATLTLGYPSGNPQLVQVATVLQQEAAQIGFTLKLVGVPNQQYGSLFTDPAARKPFDLFLTLNYVELPEPALMDQLFGGTGGGTNFSGYTNPAVDQALDQANQASDPAARARFVLEAEAQLAKDLPSIPIVQPRAIVFQNNQLTGAPLTFAYMTSPWAAAIGGK